MDLFTVEEEKKTLTIIHHLISEKVEILVNIKGSDKQFTTKLVKVQKANGHGYLIIEKLYPEVGNSIIQSSPDVVFSFALSGSTGVFHTKYRGINTQYPEFGLIVDFPATIQIEDKRGEERIENDLTKFLSAEFTLEGDSTVYQFKAVNLSSHGIGLIVDKKNLDVLDKINVGDTIKDLKLFLTVATLTIDGTVMHKTPMNRDELKGSYILGIKSDFIVDLKELENELKKVR
ncbi:MAG: flagellar brake protein [Proteobacteria bacterium]|nr:flagellar brake protein [Pseudomonadota bacterium]